MVMKDRRDWKSGGVVTWYLDLPLLALCAALSRLDVASAGTHGYHHGSDGKPYLSLPYLCCIACLVLRPMRSQPEAARLLLTATSVSTKKTVVSVRAYCTCRLDLHARQPSLDMPYLGFLAARLR